MSGSPGGEGGDGERDLLVLKFGGTSVASPARMRMAAGRIRHFVERGRRVVAVVSAPGSTTEEILGWIRGVAPVAAGGMPDPGGVRGAGRRAGADPAIHGPPAPPHRESDRALATGEDLAAALMSLALADIGVDAVSMRGGEAGLVATGDFGAGVVTSVDTTALDAALAGGRTPVVSGFQARSSTGETVTLGRGGSDWTGVLLASALGARECHIVTDVAGVFERDPRIDPTARQFRVLPPEQLVELVESGSRVVHPDAARLALRDRVVLRIHGFWEAPGADAGTLVLSGAGAVRGSEAVGVGVA